MISKRSIHKPSFSSHVLFKHSVLLQRLPLPPQVPNQFSDLCNTLKSHILQLFYSPEHYTVIVGKALISEAKFCQHLYLGFLIHKVPDLTGSEQSSTKPLIHVDFTQYQPQHMLASQAAPILPCLLPGVLSVGQQYATYHQHHLTHHSPESVSTYTLKQNQMTCFYLPFLSDSLFLSNSLTVLQSTFRVVYLLLVWEHEIDLSVFSFVFHILDHADC